MMIELLDVYILVEMIVDFLLLVISYVIVGDVLFLLLCYFDVLNMFYVKLFYEDVKNKVVFKFEYGYDLILLEIWVQVVDQVKFFVNLFDCYGIYFVGKDEGIIGCFYEMLIVEGGQFLNDDMFLVFNSKVGVWVFNFFVDFYVVKVVLVGIINYVWDDFSFGFVVGVVVWNFDWVGWVVYFNGFDSKIGGDVGVVLVLMGFGGKWIGWLGLYSFFIIKDCDNKEVVVSFLMFLIFYDSQMYEVCFGLLLMCFQVWIDVIGEFEVDNNEFMVEVFFIWGDFMVNYVFILLFIVEWGEIFNVLWLWFQVVVLGDMIVEEVLNKVVDEVMEVMEDVGYF